MEMYPVVVPSFSGKKSLFFRFVVGHFVLRCQPNSASPHSTVECCCCGFFCFLFVFCLFLFFFKSSSPEETKREREQPPVFHLISATAECSLIRRVAVGLVVHRHWCHFDWTKRKVPASFDLQGFSGFLLGFTGFFCVWRGLTEFYRVLLGFLHDLPGFSRFY